jgi:hypothetical protein
MTGEQTDRARAAWMAHQRQELLAPATALLELSEMLKKDAAERGHERFLSDQEQIHRSATRLREMLHEVLDPANLAHGHDALARRVRHDLRTPLAEISACASCGSRTPPRNCSKVTLRICARCTSWAKSCWRAWTPF